MSKKEQTTIDGLKVRSVKSSGLKKSSPKSKKRVKKPSVVKKTTVPKKKPSAFDVKVTKSRPKSEEVVVAEDITIHEEELEEARREFLEPVEAFDLNITEEEMNSNKKRKRGETKKHKPIEKKEKKKVSKARLIITSILLVIVLIVLGGLIYLLVWGNDIIDKLTGGNSNIWNALSAIASEAYEPLKTDANGRTNVLVFGTSGYTMEGDGNGGGVHDGAQLTDSIMAVSIDQETGDVAVISLPRDLKGPRTCTATGKINEVYWCANTDGTNEEAGAEALEEAVSGILGINFQYYAHLNWGALVNIVDSIGGITVTLDEDINDYNYTGAVFKKGVEYSINGEQALGLARARHGTKLGDFSRGNSQQKILIAIKDKLMSEGVNLGKITGLVNTLGDNFRTNFSVEDMKTGVHLMQELDFNNIRQIALLDWDNNVSYMTTASINGISYVIPSAGVGNYSQISNYIAKKLSSDPAVREDAKIIIYNGNGEQGLAATESERLKEGTKISSAEVADAPEGEYIGKYTLYVVDDGKKPETKKILEEFYEQTGKTEYELTNGISAYGYDFIIILGTEQEADTE